jgi:hypothetical protein
VTRPAPGRSLDLAASAALTGWIAVTALSQHPNRTFDRFRRRDTLGVVIPNWRFFAPEPAIHDFRVLHRYLRADGSQTGWKECTEISPRCWRHAVWFPDRRRDKGMIDACSELILALQVPGLDLTTTPAYRVLRDVVAVSLAASVTGEPPQGFQFLLLRHTGHDEEPEPEYLFASRFEALPDRAAL